MKTHREIVSLFWLTTAAAIGIILAGCDSNDQEKLMDAETPGVEVEIQRDVDTASTTVDVDES